jgi:hypothetical protein
MTDDPRARDSSCSSTTSSPTSSTSSQAHGTAVVLETRPDVLAKRQLPYEHDPDPAEQTVEEPAHNWPGANIQTEAKELPI